ncbi:unnamed protein product [Lota lota]
MQHTRSFKKTNQSTQMYQYQAGTAKSGFMSDAAIMELLHQRLAYVQATEDALDDYNPHLYADEGDNVGPLNELENISISEAVFEHRQLDDLGPSFNELASVCEPPKAQLGMRFASTTSAIALTQLPGKV